MGTCEAAVELGSGSQTSLEKLGAMEEIQGDPRWHSSSSFSWDTQCVSFFGSLWQLWWLLRSQAVRAAGAICRAGPWCVIVSPHLLLCSQQSPCLSAVGISPAIWVKRTQSGSFIPGKLVAHPDLRIKSSHVLGSSSGHWAVLAWGMGWCRPNKTLLPTLSVHLFAIPPPWLLLQLFNQTAELSQSYFHVWIAVELLIFVRA